MKRMTFCNRIIKLGIAALILTGLYPSIASAEEFKINSQVALPFRSEVEFLDQCGVVDDLRHVEFYKDQHGGVSEQYVDTHELSTVQFQWLDANSIRAKLPDHSPGDIGSIRWCTGTLYDDRHVITAGHCFDISKGGYRQWLTPYKLNANNQRIYAKPKTLATLMVVNFRYQISEQTNMIRTPDVFPIVALREYREGPNKIDYAIVELGKDEQGRWPGQVYSPAKVITTEPVKDDQVAIIQHPQGQPKKIEDGKVLKTSGKSVFYNDIDTHGGSSGSGVRNSKGQVIAIHTNGGCFKTQNNPGANRGLTMKAIAEVSSIF